MSTHMIRKILPHELVYFISDGTAIKIGKTQGNPMNRLSALQTGNSRTLTLEYIAWSSEVSAGGLEQHFHYRFRNSLIRGEWFDRKAVINGLLDDMWGQVKDLNLIKLETSKGIPIFVALVAVESIGQYGKEQVA